MSYYNYKKLLSLVNNNKETYIALSSKESNLIRLSKKTMHLLGKGGTKCEAKRIMMTITRFIQKLSSIFGQNEEMDHCAHMYTRQGSYSNTEKMG